MKNIKNLIAAFALAATAFGTNAAQADVKKFDQCFSDEMGRKICAVETSRQAGPMYTLVEVKAQITDEKTGKKCTADRAAVMLNPQGVMVGSSVKGIVCGK